MPASLPLRRLCQAAKEGDTRALEEIPQCARSILSLASKKPTYALVWGRVCKLLSEVVEAPGRVEVSPWYFSALSNLPPRQQLALRLKLTHPTSTYEEIGELMGGISRQAVGKLLQRAKRKRER